MALLAVLVGVLVVPLTYLAYLLLPRSPKQHRTGALPSVLIPSFTSHARLLPIPSKHSFSYPLIYIGVDIDEVAAGQLDLPGRLFQHDDHPFTKILGVRCDNYLKPGYYTFREKLNHLLLSQGFTESQMAKAWLVTMPSFLGFEGINPLTVWYVYGQDKQLSCVVLEVHNTFGEKHAYVLPTSSDTTTTPNGGYDHAWVFPRTFHVSPFNSRSGFYRLDLVDPFPTASGLTNRLPQWKVFLRLLTPDKKTKLTAVVASHPTHQAIPLDPSYCAQIVWALLRWPMTLFLATPRILYQAYILQYDKKLAMFPRPEPQVQVHYGIWNPPQKDDKSSVTLKWQELAGSEDWCRGYVTNWAQERAWEIGMRLHIHFRDGREDIRIEPVGTGCRALNIETSDPSFFVNLVVQPSSRHFMVLAPELLTEIPDRDLFLEFFKAREDYTYTGLTPDEADGSLDHKIVLKRFDYFRWCVSHSKVPPTPVLWCDVPPHFLGYVPSYDACKISQIIGHTFFFSWLEERVMYYSSARFVEGREPWKVWERALRREYVEATPSHSRKSSTGTILEGWEELGSVQYK